MAKTTPKTVKQLGQFLQEQQEPFVLEIYLSERGYQKKNLNSESSINSSQGISGKSLKRTGNCSSPHNSRKGVPQFSNVLRAVFNKLSSINGSPKIKNNENTSRKFSVTEKAGNGQEVAESDRFSSASSTTVFNSCSESDVEESSTSRQKDVIISFKADTSQCLKVWSSPGDKEATADGKLQWRRMEESKQISPVSVLEDSDRGSSLDKRREENPSRSSITLTKKITEDSVLSASFWNLLYHSAKEKASCACTGATELELQELVRSKPSSQFIKSKKIVQQTKQLLFDCVREVVESKQQSHKECLGSELIGKLICEKIKAWGKLPGGDGVSITRLLDSDFQDSVQEWNDFEPQMRDISLEIGDAILEDIKDQIVTDMIYLSKF